MAAEATALAIHRPPEPCHVGVIGPVQAEAADFERYHVERGEPVIVGVEIDDIHQRKVVTVGGVASDPFVIVEKIAAAVKNRLAVMKLNRLGVVRGVAVDDVDRGGLDQAMGEGTVL